MEDNSVKLAKIYQITSSQTDKVYIGSTTKSLEKRFSIHKSENNSTNSKEIVQYDDAIISLIEEVELEERYIRERYWIEFYGESSVNIKIPGRTKKEYYEINKEYINEKRKEYHQINKQQIMEYQKEYHEINKEQIKEKNKEYYEINKEQIKEKNMEYYEINKERINEKFKQKIICECGIQICKGNYLKHKKSKKHQDRMLLGSERTVREEQS
jgi:hypothetical protein